ncbi:MAG: PorV/PorQ family protein [bacterium]|nr:MAG: PorV/PorQ family protein [bacterium]
MKTIITVVALLVVPLASLLAGDEDAGTSGPFTLGAGGRGIAMGGAAAAVWGDSYAQLWNPAGLYRVDRSEANLFHTTLFDESTRYSSLFLSHSFLDIGVVSFGVIHLDIGGIEQRDRENRLLDGELDNRQTRYMLGFARSLYRGLSGGVRLKLDRYVQGSYVANGFGLDAGIGFESDISSHLIDGLAAGVSLSNLLEPKINLVSEESGDPRAVRFGFSLWRSISQRMNDRLLLAIDLDRARYSDTHLHVGGEYSIYDFFAVRGGWDAGIPTLGCGFRVRFIQLDYAYRSTDLGNNHLFSLIYRFGSSRTERLAERRRKQLEGIQKEIDAQVSHFEDQFVSSSLAKGQESLEQADYAKALEYFQGVLLWSPENEMAKNGSIVARGSLLMLEGDSLVKQERFAEALFSYRRAYEELQRPEIESRIAECEKRIEDASNRHGVVERILSRSLELYTEHKWDEASEGFEKVLDLVPEHALAKDYLNRTRTRIRESYERMLTRADRFVEEKRYGAALEELRKGLERYPGDEALERRVAHINELQRALAAAEREARVTAPRRAPSISQKEIEALRPAYERGYEYFKRGQFSGAIREWEKVWKRYPRFEKVADYLIKAYQYYGMELYTSHRYEESLEVWGRILEVDPDNEKALRYIDRTKEELAKLEGLSD